MDVLELAGKVNDVFADIDTLNGIWSRPAIRLVSKTMQNMVGPERGVETQEKVLKYRAELNNADDNQIHDKEPEEVKPKTTRKYNKKNEASLTASGVSEGSTQAKDKKAVEAPSVKQGEPGGVGSKRNINERDAAEQERLVTDVISYRTNFLEL